MKVSKLAVFIGLVSLTISSAMAAVQLGVDFTAPGNYAALSFGNTTYGYEFQVTTPVTVTGLAAFDGLLWPYIEPNPYLPYGAAVGLWNSTGTLLASATIAPDTAPNAGLFATVAIAPIVVQPGYYDVGAQSQGMIVVGSDNALPGFTTAPGISFVTGVTYNSSIPNLPTGLANLNFPSTILYDPGNESEFGGNIVLGAAPVPEPTTLISGALLLLPFGSSALRQLRKKFQSA